MTTPEFTIRREDYDAMVSKLCNQIATLELIIDYASVIDESLEIKFLENWKQHPEITKPTKEYFNKKRGE